MPASARQKREDGVGAVAIERGVHAVRQQVQRRDEGVREGVEILVADGGQILGARRGSAGSGWRARQ